MKFLEKLTSIYKRLGSGIAANAYAQAVTLAIQILSLPILINIWGLERYGQWIVLASIQGYFSLTDLGLMAAVMNRLTNMDSLSVQKGERKTLYATSLSFCLAMGVLVTTLSAVIILLHVEPNQYLTEDSALALILLIAHSQVSLFNTGVDAAFRVQNKYATGTTALETVRAIEWIVGMTAVHFYGTMTSLAFGMLATRTVMLGSLLISASYMGYECRMQKANIQLSLLLSLKNSAGSWFSVRITDAIAIQGITLAVAHFFGAVKAAEYNAYRTVSRIIVQLTSAVANSAWPMIAREYANNNKLALKELTTTNLFIAACSAGVIAILMNVLFPYILHRWTHDTIDHDQLLAVLFLAASFLASISYMARIILMATDSLQSMALAYKVSTILAVALIVFLASGDSNLHSTALAVLLAELTTLYVGLRAVRKVAR